MNPEPLKCGTQICFKSRVAYNAKANAIFLRDLGKVNNEAVCCILRNNHEWIVRWSEIDIPDRLRGDWAKNFLFALESLGKEYKTNVQKAKAAGISPTTLYHHQRMAHEILGVTPPAASSSAASPRS